MKNSNQCATSEPPTELEPPDSFHLKAAEGWLGLGNYLEAHEELKKVSLQARFHPNALIVRWEIYAQAKHWEFAYTIAHGLVALAPNEPRGWVYRSVALHQLKRTAEAWYYLLPAAQKFPQDPTVAYNLACYACQLGKIEDARRWLDRATKSGDAREIRRLAADDEDLRPLWAKED